MVIDWGSRGSGAQGLCSRPGLPTIWSSKANIVIKALSLFCEGPRQVIFYSGKYHPSYIVYRKDQQRFGIKI